jgi:hypothetical protein
MRALALLAFLVMAAPVQASGRLTCRADDEHVILTASGRVAPGRAGAITGFDAELALKEPGLPADLARAQFRGADLFDRWVMDGEVRLRLYRERESGPYGSIDVIVTASREGAPPGEPNGTYAVNLASGEAEGLPEGVERLIEGPVLCALESAP